MQQLKDSLLEFDFISNEVVCLKICTWPFLEPPRLLVWLMKRIVFGVVLRVQEQARLRYEQRIKYVVIYRKLGLTDQWIKIVDQEVWKTQKPLKDGPWTGRVFNVTVTNGICIIGCKTLHIFSNWCTRGFHKVFLSVNFLFTCESARKVPI